MAYQLKQMPQIQSVEDLRQWAENEFRQVALSQAETLEVELRLRYQAPEKPREGMIVAADGLTWNPGGGKGIYAYLGGAWVKLS